MCLSATKCFAPAELGSSESFGSINIWSRWDPRLPQQKVQTGLITRSLSLAVLTSPRRIEINTYRLCRR
ncbi:MAG: hypothetical protein QOH71_4157 [Blastocatellia bacterium]|nr:hypothetical protein [Blastocatellia bacterium]